MEVVVRELSSRLENKTKSGLGSGNPNIFVLDILCLSGCQEHRKHRSGEQVLRLDQTLETRHRLRRKPLLVERGRRSCPRPPDKTLERSRPI